MGFVVSVSGAVGGVGTSTFAYALALQAQGSSVLIDVQWDGAPLDVVVGVEAEPGARWSQVRVQSDSIDADTVLSALPVAHGVHVLSSDRDGTADTRAVGHLVNALRDQCELVVLDLPLRHPATSLVRADARVLVMPATIAAVAAAYGIDGAPQCFVVVDTGHADFPGTRITDYLDGEIVGTVRWQRAVTLAAGACLPLPSTSDVMRVAAALRDRVRDVA